MKPIVDPGYINFDTFPIKNGLKQVDTSLPMLLNPALEYDIRKVQAI